MTLLVITLSALVLVGIARRSLLQAERAAEAEFDLQRSWGTLSCQRALLADAEAWLMLPDGVAAGPLRDKGHRRLVFFLGGLEFDVLLANESAKLNLNAMIEWLPLGEVRQLVTELARSTPPLRAELRPFSFASLDLVPQPQQPTAEPPRLESWGQVFPSEQFADPTEFPRLLAAVTVDLTCWGDGKLSVEHASEAALRALCDHLVAGTVANELLKARAASPQLGKDELLATLDLDPEEFTMLASLLTDTPSCFSMWLKVSQGTRGWYEFSVASVEQRMSPSSADASMAPDAARPQSIPLARFSW